MLCEILLPLRTAAETVLGEPLPEGTVFITIPWMTSWQHDSIDVRIVNGALHLAGLKPMLSRPNDPDYISEASAVLAANGRRLCQDRHCVGPEHSEEETITNEIIYFIR